MMDHQHQFYESAEDEDRLTVSCHGCDYDLVISKVLDPLVLERVHAWAAAHGFASPLP